MICAHCGKEISDDARFCSGCGKPVVDEPLQPKATGEENAAPASDVAPTPDVALAPDPAPDYVPDAAPASDAAPSSDAALAPAHSKVNVLIVVLAVVAIVLAVVLVFLLWNLVGPGASNRQTQGGYAVGTEQAPDGSSGGAQGEAGASSSAQDDSSSNSKAEEEKAKEEERARAEEKAREEAKARANAYIDAYEATLDVAPSDTKYYSLVEMSGDDVPELIISEDPGVAERKHITIYWYNPDSQTLVTAGTDDLHPNRDHLMMAAEEEHSLINAGYYGGQVMYREFAVANGSFEQVGDGRVDEKTGPDEMGWVNIPEFDPHDTSPLEALRQ